MSATFASVFSRFTISPPAAILEVPKKTAVIRLRWPVVILGSYLLLYSGGAGRLNLLLAHALLLSYLLSNAALYWLDEEFFSSSYFYAPLVFFDLLFLSIAVSVSGRIGADFYLAYFVTVVLCGICKDFRGWIVVTLLSPVVYGYFLFQSGAQADPILYLQVPFPLVVALFYGYFVQVENFERTVKDYGNREAERRKTEEQMQRQLERIRTLNRINLAVTSSLDFNSVLEVLQERVERLLPAAATAVWLVNRETGDLEPTACRNLNEEQWRNYRWRGRGFTAEVFRSRQPLVVNDLPSDRRTWNPEFFRAQGLVSYLGVPLVVRDESLGVVSFYTRVAHEFTDEEVEFLSSMAAQAAIAIHNSWLFQQVEWQAVELENSNRVKDEFLNTMTHELRTPLNVIVGYAGMIKDRMLGEISAEQERSLDKIMGRSQDLISMINGILQATAIEAGAVRAESQPVNVAEFLRELQSAYEAPLNKDVTLVWDYPADLPTIRTDKDKLRRILEHLIHNAIKFTPQGEITISARDLPPEKKMQFRVSDTGIGIPPDSLSLIFEKFHQVNSPETRVNGGVGLGLYLARRFAELIGGTIEVQSEPGKGSVFTVTVPY